MPFLSTAAENTRLSLLQFPIELLLHLCTFLPPSAVAALALTSKSLYHTLPRPQILPRYGHSARNLRISANKVEFQKRCFSLSAPSVTRTHRSPPKAWLVDQIAQQQIAEFCSKRAIRTFLRQDTVVCRRCMLCKNVLPITLFSGEFGFRGVPRPNEFCFWCAARLTRVIVLPNRLSDDERGALAHRCWYSSRETMCMHCGGIAVWDGQPCGCSCETCWYRDVNVFTRFVKNWLDYPSYEFHAGADGELLVAETTPQMLQRSDHRIPPYNVFFEEVPVLTVTVI